MCTPKIGPTDTSDHLNDTAQDEGSQLVALASRAKPGDTVLDLCAGNGGKSLGALMG